MTLNYKVSISQIVFMFEIIFLDEHHLSINQGKGDVIVLTMVCVFNNFDDYFSTI